MESLSIADFRDTAGSETSIKRQETSPSQFFRRVVYDGLVKSSGFAAIGLVFRRLGHPGAWPFLGSAIGMLGMRLVVNLTKEYQLVLSDILEGWGDKTWDLIREYPLIKAVAYVFVVVAAYFFPMVSFTSGICLGALSALTIDIQLCLKQQQVQDAESDGDLFNQLV